MRRLALIIVLLAVPTPAATAAVQLPTAPAPYALGDRDVRSLVRLSPTTFIAGTDGGIFLSRNTARSFQRRYAGSVAALTKDARSSRTVYAAIGGRIVRSTNAGLTWKVMRKLRATGPQPPDFPDFRAEMPAYMPRFYVAYRRPFWQCPREFASAG